MFKNEFPNTFIFSVLLYILLSFVFIHIKFSPYMLQYLFVCFIDALTIMRLKLITARKYSKQTRLKVIK
jgi:hypothetical protein